VGVLPRTLVRQAREPEIKRVTLHASPMDGARTPRAVKVGFVPVVILLLLTSAASTPLDDHPWRL